MKRLIIGIGLGLIVGMSIIAFVWTSPATLFQIEDGGSSRISVDVIGSVDTHSYSVKADDITVREIIDETSLSYEENNSKIVSINSDTNSRSMRWVIYINGIDCNLDSRVYKGDIVEIIYRNYMEV